MAPTVSSITPEHQAEQDMREHGQMKEAPPGGEVGGYSLQMRGPIRKLRAQKQDSASGEQWLVWSQDAGNKTPRQGGASCEGCRQDTEASGECWKIWKREMS